MLMASEPRDGGVPLELPESLGEWLDERAEQLGVPREELLAALISAYRVAIEDGDLDPSALAEALEVEQRIESTEESIREEMTQQLREVEERRKETLDDVRKRVLQVKQTTEAKAETDHTHEELRRMDDLAATVEHVDRRIEELTETVESRGAEVEDIAGELDDLNEKLTRVAQVVVELRAEQSEERDGDVNEALAALREQAARKDVARANCAACEEPIDVSLLDEAACPHCNAAFGGVTEASGFFGSPKLVGPEDQGGDE